MDAKITVVVLSHNVLPLGAPFPNRKRDSLKPKTPESARHMQPPKTTCSSLSSVAYSQYLIQCAVEDRVQGNIFPVGAQVFGSY